MPVGTSRPIEIMDAWMLALKKVNQKLQVPLPMMIVTKLSKEKNCKRNRTGPLVYFT